VVIVFIIVGFGIMLRIKIDPRTVMSIQNTIPKIIIGLLLITFSYAIVGVLIDFTYVITFLLLNIIAKIANDSSTATSLFQASNPYDALNLVMPNTIPGVGSVVGNFGITASVWSGATLIGNMIATALNSNILGSILNGVLSIFALIYNIPCWLGALIGGNINNCNPVSTIQVIAEIFVFIALMIAVVVALFRFWLGLLTAYISVIFAVILGPIRLLGGLLPGSVGGGAGGWFRDLIANLAVFPVSLSFILLTGTIAKTLNAVSIETTQFGNYFIMPMLPGINIGGMIALVAMLTVLPKLPDQVRETLKSKDIFGPQFGTMLGVGTKSLSRTIGLSYSAVGKTPKPGEPGGLYSVVTNLFR